MLAAVLAVAGCGDSEPLDMAAVDRGAELAQDCAACHALEDRRNEIGPHLVDVMGRRIASVSDYAYSQALLAEDFDWNEERMIAFILAPTEEYPGTKMAYGGIDRSEAADIVEYLRFQSR